MANTFTNAKAQGVTSVTTIYTAPASTKGIILQLDISNKHATLQTVVDVEHVTGATGTNIVNQIPIPTGSTLEVISSGKKIILNANEFIRVTSTQIVDVVMSVMEKS